MSQGYPVNPMYQYQQQPQQQHQQQQPVNAQWQYAPQPAPPVMQAPLPQPPQQLPQFYMPADPNEAQRAFQASVGKSGKVNGLQVRYADIPGPRGEKDWKGVPTGYQGSQRVYLLPSWRPDGMPIFVLSEWHFWKSMRYPKGMSLGCPGRDGCEICQAALQAEGHPDQRVAQRAHDFGRNRRKWLYQVACLDFPQIHMYEDGTFRPLILSCSYTLQQSLLNVCTLKHRSITDCVHPNMGNPWIIGKKKTGVNAMDVEYSAIDLPPEPLPQQFWGLLQNLWDLNQLLRTSTPEERHMAAIDMGLITGGAMVQVPQQYQQAPQQLPPQPAYQQPAYQQPQQYPAAPGMGMPGYAQPMVQPPPQQYQQPAYQPQQYQQPAYQPPPSEEQQLQFPPPDAPPYGAFAQPPQQPMSYQQPQPQVPPAPPPPPLPAAPAAPPVAYQPQPAAAGGQVMPFAVQQPMQAPPATVPMPPPPPIPAQAPQVQQLQDLQNKLAGK